jgi:hypothetical protein
VGKKGGTQGDSGAGFAGHAHGTGHYEAVERRQAPYVGLVGVGKTRLGGKMDGDDAACWQGVGPDFEAEFLGETGELREELLGKARGVGGDGAEGEFLEEESNLVPVVSLNSGEYWLPRAGLVLNGCTYW